MNIYIAGTFHNPLIGQGHIQKFLQEAGHIIVSTWHSAETWKAGEARPFEEKLAIAETNYRDIDKADMVLVVPLKGHPGRGFHCEMIYAYGRSKPVLLLGDHTDANTMAMHRTLKFAKDFDEILARLEDTAQEVAHRAAHANDW